MSEITRLMAERRFPEAGAACQLLLRREPDNVAAWINFAGCLLNLSRFEQAVAAAERALAASPNDSRALNAKGTSLLALGRPEEALVLLDKAVECDAFNAQALMNRGLALIDLGRVDEAVASLDSAIALEPRSPEAYYHKGLALFPINRREEALKSFDGALSIAPQDADYLYAKGLALLAFGRWREAWPLVERRWQARYIRQSPALDREERRWNGERLTGLLRLWQEQGIGEQILYASLLPLVLQRATKVTLECDARLAPLVQRSYPQIDVVKPPAEMPRASAQCPLGSLGAALNLGPEQVTGQPYLRADPGRRAELRARYEQAAEGKPIIGISWFSKNAPIGREKSSPLSDWGPLLRRPYHFVNVQFQAIDEEILAAQHAFGCAIATDASVDQGRDLEGFAAQIGALDGVVSVSNSTVHMAGALGIPCIALLPPGRGLLWYWGADGDSTPWYESVHLIRRLPGASWSEQVARADLRLLASSR